MKHHVKRNVMIWLLATLLLMPSLFALTSKESAMSIDLAGKQHILIQRMVNDLQLISKGIDTKNSRADLLLSAKEFETILHGLQKGDKSLHLQATKLPAIKKELQKGERLWKEIKPSMRKPPENPKLLTEMISRLKMLQVTMDKVVKKYEKSIQREKQALALSSLVKSFMKQKKSENHVVNLAGKQRMLTQKMTKLALLVTLGIDKEANKKRLQQAAALYAKTLEGFAKGDSALGLEAAKSPEVVAYLKEVNAAWKPFSQNIQKIIGSGGKDTKALGYVVRHNEALLKKSHHLVQLFKKSGGKKSFMEKARLNIVDIAGRQRMLTQKMTKEKLLILAKVSPKQNDKKLHETIGQFDSALKMLVAGDASHRIPKPSNAKMIAQLRRVSGLWEKLKPIYLQKKTGKKALSAIVQGNPVLLKEMNKAVHISEVVADY
ncbi:MAG: hypothetical protein DSZ05_04935 [Sulfurospirillum sp.]|nr:MAG: hypothetical protein DSZ05_04935 [Sulfurospirillum sp.]